MTITLRDLHLRVRKWVPHIKEESMVTEALRTAAITVCRETFASRQTVSFTLAANTVPPYVPTLATGTTAIGLVSAYMRRNGTTDDYADLPTQPHPLGPLPSTTGVPGYVSFHEDQLWYFPTPDASYDFTVTYATEPIGDFLSVNLPREAEDAMVDLAIADLMLVPDDKGNINGAGYAMRHRRGITKCNDILFKTSISATGDAQLGVDPTLNYFRSC